MPISNFKIQYKKKQLINKTLEASNCEIFYLIRFYRLSYYSSHLLFILVFAIFPFGVFFLAFNLQRKKMLSNECLPFLFLFSI